MPRIDATTNAQTKFLRAYHSDPLGPPAELWPSPAILRRWLRRDGFRRALLDVRETLRFQTDLHLACAASRAAMALSATSDMHPAPTTIDEFLQVLRLAHLRQRFPADPPASPRALEPPPALQVVPCQEPPATTPHARRHGLHKRRDNADDERID